MTWTDKDQRKAEERARELAEEEETKAHVEVRSAIVLRCSACGSTAQHHVAYVEAHGVCVV